MADHSALAAEMAADLMLFHARSITPLEVRNAFEDYEACPDLGTPEAQALIDAVLNAIETADIDITTH
jgi:hypothetical protein